MPEYHALRVLLAIAEILLTVVIVRHRIGYLFWFLVFLWADATNHLMPALVWSASWQVGLQAPVLSLLLVISAIVSVDLFSFTRCCMYREERRTLMAASCVAGMVPMVGGWVVTEHVAYQLWMLVREYCLIGITFATITAWAWVAYIKPVNCSLPSAFGSPTCGQCSIPPLARKQITVWIAWLAAWMPAAASTKGGLLWAFFKWEGGVSVWRWANAMSSASRLILAIYLAVYLQRLARTGDAPSPRSSGFVPLMSQPAPPVGFPNS